MNKRSPVQSLQLLQLLQSLKNIQGPTQEKRMESLHSITCAGSMGIISASNGTPNINGKDIKVFSFSVWERLDFYSNFTTLSRVF